MAQKGSRATSRAELAFLEELQERECLSVELAECLMGRETDHLISIGVFSFSSRLPQAMGTELFIPRRFHVVLLRLASALICFTYFSFGGK